MQSYVGRVYVRLLGVTFIIIVLATTGFSQNMFRKMNDFDGDGKTDFAITRREGNSKVWYIWQSRDGFKVFQWGLSSDMNAAGDYDGDGKTDFAIWRGQNFPDPILVPRFWIWNSGSSNVTQVNFDNIFRVDATMQQDYNGDGKTDPAVLIGNVLEPPGSGHTSVYGKYSGTAGTVQFGIPPFSFPRRVGDLTGDGRSDYVYISYSSSPFTVNITNAATGASNSIQYGRSGDQYVPADFDGDGIGDLAIWRSSDGTWWWLRSSDNTVRAAKWGVSGDIPVPGDYDGDGITDLAIWRPGSTQAYYWIYGSQNGISVFPWGLPTDTIVQP
jgi:FG-GAP-like repeat